MARESIGVIICTCGPNIGDQIDVDHILRIVRKLDGVAFAQKHTLLCSAEGLKMLQEEIIKEKLNRIVIAACTPKMYERKFMNAVEEAGLNSHLMQMTNIREQCAWVTPNREMATDKAEGLVMAAVNRVKLQRSIERKQISICPDVLVIGGGVTGLEASLTLSGQKGRKVYLVEKDPWLGGYSIRFEEVFPTLECAPCMMAPLLQDSLQKENIEIFGNSEVTEIVGSYGNFTATIQKNARYVDEAACIGCGACFEPCPVETENRYDGHLSKRKAIYIPFAGVLPNVPAIDEDLCKRFLGEECSVCDEACSFDALRFDDEGVSEERKVGAVIIATGTELFEPQRTPHGFGLENVFTALQVERMNAESGPTGGKIVLRNGKVPKSISIIYCVGRDEVGYCSGICCMYSLTLAHLIKKKVPDVNIHHLYQDLCLPKKEHQKMYRDALAAEMDFVRQRRILAVNNDGHKLSVEYEGISGSEKLDSDMVILSQAMAPGHDTTKIAALFDIPLDERGFFSEEHSLLRPFGTVLEGVFVCGSCQGPKDIGDAVAHANAAAAKILARLVPGEKLELESKVTEIDEEVCSGCSICIHCCPFSAISRDTEKSISVVDETLCRGCGTCGAACPTGAAEVRHFTNEQIIAEIKGVI